MGAHSSAKSSSGLKELKITKRSTNQSSSKLKTPANSPAKDRKNTPAPSSSAASTSVTPNKDGKRLSSGLLLAKTLSPDKNITGDQWESHIDTSTAHIPAPITPTSSTKQHSRATSAAEHQVELKTQTSNEGDIDVGSMMRRVSNSLHQHHKDQTNPRQESTGTAADVTSVNIPLQLTTPKNRSKYRSKRQSQNSVFSSSSIETADILSNHIRIESSQPEKTVTLGTKQPVEVDNHKNDEINSSIAENDAKKDHAEDKESTPKLEFKNEHADTLAENVDSENLNESEEDGCDDPNSDSDDSIGWQEMEPVASHTIYDENGKLQVHNQAIIDTQEKHRNYSNHNHVNSGSTKDAKNAPTRPRSDSNNSKRLHNKNFTDDDFDIEEAQINSIKHASPKKDTFGYTKLDDEEQALRSRKTNKKIDFLFTSAGRAHSRSQLNVASTDSLKSPSSESLGSQHTERVFDSKELHGADNRDPLEKEAYQDDEEDVLGGLTHEELTAEHQLSSMKNLLTDKEKFAYVGAVFVLITQYCADLAQLCLTSNMLKKNKLAKQLQDIQKKAAYWQVDIMSRLYHHLEISDEEIEMIKKLGLHGLDIRDLCKSIKVARSFENPYHEQDLDLADESKSEELNEDKHQETQENTTGNNEATEKAAFDESEKVETQSETQSEATDTIANNEHESSSEDHQMKSSETAPENVITVDMIRNDKKLDIDVSWTIICDFFLLLLAKSSYDARSRTLLINFANHLNISSEEINHFEKRVIEALELEQSTDEQVWNERDLMDKRRKKIKKKKLVYVGLATLGGSLVLGVSGGLLAPVIGAGVAAGLSTIGIGSISGFLTGAGGTAAVAATSTAIGANIGKTSMTKRMGSVRTFEFKPLHNNRRVNLIISVSGWMVGNEDDVRLPFSTLDPIEGDLYSLYWEPEMLKSTGQTINILASEIITQTIQQILGATILTALMAAIQLPMALSKLGYIIDNPWNVSLDRAWNAGLILADTLASKNLGERPITLIGFSLGSRVIYSCLKELCRKGMVGIVENVIIFGSPVVCHRDELVMCRSVVSGRFVNGYSLKDWILGYLFRATGGGLKTVAGLSPVETVDNIENFDCSEWVQGHMEYRKNIPKLLKELGLSVLSEEFVEIDDSPDPEQLKKQRELIHSLDEAQKALDSKKSHKNSWLPKWLKPKKQNWQEMMEDETSDTHKKDGVSQTSVAESTSVLDTDALQRELEHVKNSVVNSPHLLTNVKAQSNVEKQNEKDNNTEEVPQPPKPVKQNVSFQLLNAGQAVKSHPREDDAEFSEMETKQFQFGDDF
ncbi:hypothetical protein ACO0QE_003085 [Hanseniaspora vineae]